VGFGTSDLDFGFLDLAFGIRNLVFGTWYLELGFLRTTKALRPLSFTKDLKC
jgi:hypothetical protein